MGGCHVPGTCMEKSITYINVIGTAQLCRDSYMTSTTLAPVGVTVQMGSEWPTLEILDSQM